jgi:hypothetical protein
MTPTLSITGIDEPERELADRELVAVFHDRDGVGGGGEGDALGAEDLRVRVHHEDAIELLRGPVIGVLVRDDDAHDVAEVGQRHRERPGIDDEGVVRHVENESGVLVFGQLHAATVPSRRRNTLPQVPPGGILLT